MNDEIPLQVSDLVGWHRVEVSARSCTVSPRPAHVEVWGRNVWRSPRVVRLLWDGFLPTIPNDSAGIRAGVPRAECSARGAGKARCERLDRGVNLALVAHLVGDLLDGVHHRGVITISERLTDVRQ